MEMVVMVMVIMVEVADGNFKYGGPVVVMM